MSWSITSEIPLMNLADSFLQDIIENPAADCPRLAFADWLEEHGQADRADFIRVQCELAKLAENDPRQPLLERRSQELLEEHAQEWLKPLPEWVVRTDLEWR